MSAILDEDDETNAKKKTRLRATTNRRDLSDKYRIHDIKVKNPSRVVPTVSGFSALTKQEVKKDTREIEKKTIFVRSVESDDDDDDYDEEERYPFISSKPAHADSSSLEKKKALLVACLQDPTALANEIAIVSKQTEQLGKELFAVEKEEDEWVGNLELCHQNISLALTHCSGLLQRYRTEADLLCTLLNSDNPYGLKAAAAVAAATTGAGAGGSCTNTAASASDAAANKTSPELPPHSSLLFEEWNAAKRDLETSIKRFEEASKKASSSTSSSASASASASGTAVGPSPFHRVRVTVVQREGMPETAAGGSVPMDVVKKEKEKEKDFEGGGRDAVRADTCAEAMVRMFTTLEASIRNHEFGYFDPEVVALTDDELAAISGSGQSDSYSKDLLKYATLVSEKDWGAVLEEAWPAPGGRRRRKSSGVIPMTAFSVPRTPFGPELRVSTLSQFEDKFLGVMPKDQGKEREKGKGMESGSLPPDVAHAEDVSLKCAHQLSVIAGMEARLNRLSGSVVSWQEQVKESVDAVREAETLLRRVTSDYFYGHSASITEHSVQGAAAGTSAATRAGAGAGGGAGADVGSAAVVAVVTEGTRSQSKSVQSAIAASRLSGGGDGKAAGQSAASSTTTSRGAARQSAAVVVAEESSVRGKRKETPVAAAPASTSRPRARR